MCCHTGSYHASQNWRHQHVCFCGCEGPGGLSTGWVSKKQRVAWLEEQLEDLRDKAQAVEEHILQIKKEK